MRIIWLFQLAIVSGKTYILILYYIYIYIISGYVYTKSFQNTILPKLNNKRTTI